MTEEQELTIDQQLALQMAEKDLDRAQIRMNSARGGVVAANRQRDLATLDLADCKATLDDLRREYGIDV